MHALNCKYQCNKDWYRFKKENLTENLKYLKKNAPASY